MFQAADPSRPSRWMILASLDNQVGARCVRPGSNAEPAPARKIKATRIHASAREGQNPPLTDIESVSPEEKGSVLVVALRKARQPLPPTLAPFGPLACSAVFFAFISVRLGFSNRRVCLDFAGFKLILGGFVILR